MRKTDLNIEEIIKSYENSRKIFKNIYKEFGISVEEFYEILENYYKSQNKEIYTRYKSKEINNEKEEITDEEIYNLREQGLTYQAITEYFIAQGKIVNVSKIYYRCKKIYEEKNEEKKRGKRKFKQRPFDDEIYRLREQGLNYKEITEKIRSEGKEISNGTVNYRCKKIYEQKGKEEPKIRQKGNTSVVTDEEIYELREKNFSYQAIENYFASQGRRISHQRIELRCKRIYKEKQTQEPKKRILTDEEIYNLRETGLTYQEMQNYFKEKGIIISISTISFRCKKIYEKEGKPEPKAKKQNKGRTSEKIVTDEEIYYLKENGFSCKAISEYFTKEGKPISYKTIYYRCKRIYKEYGEAKPRAKSKTEKIIKDEEIYELREQGLTYEEMEEYFTKKGRPISYRTIYYRCKKIYEEKGEPEPRARNKKEKNRRNLIKAIINLTTTRKATLEQISKIAEIYGINLEELFENSLDER